MHKMVKKMMNNYTTSKKKPVNYCCVIIIIAIIIVFSFSLGLPIVGTVNVAADSISSSEIGGGAQEIQVQEEPQQQQQQQQQTPQMCSTSSITGGTDASTTIGMIVTNSNNSSTSLYQNPKYGIQILCPQNWIYGEEENVSTGDFSVYFTPLTEVQQSQSTGEMPPVVSAVTTGVPSTNFDLRLFAHLNIRDLTSSGNKIISTTFNGTLSGMPAFEVVFVDANGTMSLQDWTILGDRAYGVAYATDESRFEQFIPIARDMISSFVIASEVNTLTGNEGNATTTTTTDLNTSNTTTQSQISSESPPTTTITSSTTGGGNQSIDLEAAKQQYLTVWNQTQFHIPFSTYVEPEFETAYGIYEEHGNNNDNNIFRPGETMVLYAEPVAFGHQLIVDDNGNTRYLMNFTADVIITDANNGNELATIKDLQVGSMISHRQNTELHLTLELTQDSPFPAGDYIITYIVHDQVSGESSQIEKRITIAAADGGDDNDGSGNAATTIATVQEEQQLQ